LTLVDTNILLDLVTDDSDWPGLSVAKLEEVALKGALAMALSRRHWACRQ
jgi:hypothetical protein